jgi:hypothetical protein
MTAMTDMCLLWTQSMLTKTLFCNFNVLTFYFLGLSGLFSCPECEKSVATHIRNPPHFFYKTRVISILNRVNEVIIIVLSAAQISLKIH